ncbi:MAG: RNA polymerase sigma factor [Pseudomonadota bacterium]
MLKATGDMEALGELYRRHIGTVRGYLRSLGTPASKVDDVAQQSFLTALLKIGQFREESTFRTWLFTIAYRHFLQQYRRDKNESEASERLQREQYRGKDDLRENPEERLEISDALERLSEEERSALILCDAYGYTHSEAAAITGRPLGTLKSHVQRARAKAKQILSDGDDHEDGQ